MIVPIHAARAEDGALSDWMEKNKVPFKTGTIAGDINKTRLAWGAASLPHLLLTDKKRIVAAEGFGIDELDKQIEATAGR